DRPPRRGEVGGRRPAEDDRAHPVDRATQRICARSRTAAVGDRATACGGRPGSAGSESSAADHPWTREPL
ncbi:MAG: hypothetical protein AVDCRST_MAG20-2524, partial [uncultured Acidimicrobiales bacterium]